MENAPVRPGDVIAGKFRVERLLGEGGMGVVVAALHLELEQRVAVKFLLPEIAKRNDAAERFRREARAAVKIRSEHVARVLDVGSTEDGVPYMVMEYLEGHDLGDELRERGQLPVGEAVSFMLQASEAVAEAHAAGIVHRDLKPANLFLSKRADGSRLIKVLDFGISKSVMGGSSSDLSLTATSALIGSPLYMSPEQMHSAKNVDTRTDIWALGAILFQLLANRPPYVAESIPQLCSALLNDLPPPLSDFRPDIPPELQAVVTRALAKDREQRWQSVGDMSLALCEFAPEARVHAERASRMHSSQSGITTPSLTDAEREVPPRPASVSVAISNDSPLANLPTESSSPKAIAERTLNSWGKTGGSQSAAAEKPRRPIAAIAAGGVAALALVAFGVSRTTATATPSATPATEPPATLAAQSPVPAEPTPAVAPAPIPKPQEPVAADVADAAAQPTPAKPAVKSTPAHVNVPGERPNKPSTKPPPPTDFGGRR
ncbi:MAG: protein kinase [Myxococcales bacterium]|nr:protein kinase [Myxococcales bacterium]